MNLQPQIVIAAEANIKIHSIDDLSEVLGAVYGSSALLFTEQELSPEFFDLKTGIAGEAFQKFTNYHIRTAIVIEDPQKYGPRVRELIFEHQKHNLIRFFTSFDDAKSWLISQTS
jgi:hypothetical protein